MSKYKTLKIAVASIIALIALVLALGYFFVKSIINQRTCEWANIDNIEVHAKVNVPSIEGSDCQYNESTNVKRAKFALSPLDMTAYIAQNKLQSFQEGMPIDEDTFLSFEQDSHEDANLFGKHVSLGGKEAYALLDSATRELWVTIQFED